MKIFRYAIILCCTFVLLAGCTSSMHEEDDRSLSDDTELYRAGLDLISVMDEMIRSEEYAELMGINDLYEPVWGKVNTGDYDSPVAVYKILPPKFSDMLKVAGEDATDSWDKLSHNVKKQVENRMSFSSIFSSSYNGRVGADCLALSVAYQASDRNDDIFVEEESYLLYVFEEGTPVLVTFTEYGSIRGTFLFLENTDDLDEIKSSFKEFNCSVIKIK